jgi:hypothetical protein
VATKKKPPVMTECEVKVRGRWLPRTLYEALTERDDIMRCKYCYGPEPEPTSNTCKDTPTAGSRAESNRNIRSR